VSGSSSRLPPSPPELLVPQHLGELGKDGWVDRWMDVWIWKNRGLILKKRVD